MIRFYIRLTFIVDIGDKKFSNKVHDFIDASLVWECCDKQVPKLGYNDSEVHKRPDLPENTAVFNLFFDKDLDINGDSPPLQLMQEALDIAKKYTVHSVLPEKNIKEIFKDYSIVSQNIQIEGVLYDD